jgi:peptidoglycan/xylan/chitin deacetylase (PgdA/CDA1 family)
MRKALNIEAARRAAALLLLLSGTCVAAMPASAADCPGNPEALGTSRTLVVDPNEHRRIGTMQYEETLPLQDHEVVLTFDDGPLPPHSAEVLDLLAAQCVKATFFIIGRMARSFPEGVRRVRAAGHSIGTHTQNHPLSMNRMPIERARQEIDDGIAATEAALGSAGGLSPFFRIPGLLRAEAVEDYLASKGIQTWSADCPADDWRHIPPARVYELAMKRLEAKGKGILLLHDIQGRTAQALPKILHDLKARGFRIVHVVAATPDRPKTLTEPQEWQLHPVSETVAIARWPKIPAFVFAGTATLPAPALPDLDWRAGGPAVPASQERPRQLARAAIPLPMPRPSQPPVPAGDTAATLPVPDQSLFAIQEKTHPAIAQAAVAIALPAGATTATARPTSFNANASQRMIPAACRSPSEVSSPGRSR